jgi:hypothetical protein
LATHMDYSRRSQPNELCGAHDRQHSRKPHPHPTGSSACVSAAADETRRGPSCSRLQLRWPGPRGRSLCSNRVVRCWCSYWRTISAHSRNSLFFHVAGTSCLLVCPSLDRPKPTTRSSPVSFHYMVLTCLVVFLGPVLSLTRPNLPY